MANSDYFKNIEQVFTKYSSKLKRNIQKELSWTDNAKDLIDVEPKGKGLVIAMPLYAWVIDTGRRPGAKMPPPSALYGWLEKKSIPLSAAFPIARSIGVKGIKARPWIDAAIDVPNLMEDIANKIVYNMILEIERTENQGKFMKGRIPHNK